MAVTGYRRIILTGGIGSGKSYVAGRLRRRGWAVIEADRIGHELLEPGGEAFAAVAARWPEAVARGRIDRAQLATVVFADAGQLAELEALTHPLIRQTILDRLDDTDADAVVEIPLLRDWFAGWPIVVVSAPLSVRRRRLIDRGMDADDIDRRIASQPSDGDWGAAAHFVITNDGSEALEPQFDALDAFLAGFSVPGDR